MFKDKAVEEVVRALADRFDRWYLGGLDGPRGQSAATLAIRVRSALPDAELAESPTVHAAYAAAMSDARPDDRVVVFGSFQTVGAILKDR
jgi:dihydrofolate synthase/folylpolyglutamate synthase